MENLVRPSIHIRNLIKKIFLLFCLLISASCSIKSSIEVDEDLVKGPGSSAPSIPSLSIADVSVNENAGTAIFTVTLSAASTSTVTVDYAAAAGSASGAGVDYALVPGTLTIPAGSTIGTITVTIINDLIDENDETFSVNLANPLAASIQNTSAIGTIVDDDGAPSVSFAADQNISEPTNGNGDLAVNVSVTLAAASASNVTVPYTVSGTASGGGVDHDLVGGNIVVTAGSTTGQVTFNIKDDLSIEPSETIILTMGTPTNANQGAQTTHTVTINDNDITLGAFSVSGITGGSDSTQDAYLNGGVNATVSWGSSANATDYDVTIYQNDGTTIECATQNTVGTSYNFSSCNLTAGSSYKAKVTAKATGATSLDATNSLFSFFVNRAPAVTTSGTWYVLSGGSLSIDAQYAGAPAVGTAQDADGDTLTFSATGAASSGVGSVTNNSTYLTYSPGSYTGVETFTFSISDGKGGSVSGAITINVVTATTWTGAGGNPSWDTAGNWCGAVNTNKTGCTNAGPIPGASSTAIFDAICSSNCDATLGSNTTVGGIKLSSGSITQGAFTLTLNSNNWIQTGGTFTGSSSNITLGSNFSLTGGTFNSTSGVFQVGYVGAIGSDNQLFVVSNPGVFTHNNGTVYFRVAMAQTCASATLAKFNIDVPNGMNFYHVKSSNILQGCQTMSRVIAASGKVPVIKGDLTLDNTGIAFPTSFEGVWELEGNYTQAAMNANDSTRKGLIRMIGSANQTYSASGTNTRAPGLEINKSGGVVTPGTIASSFAASKFILTNGSFTAPSGTFEIGQTQSHYESDVVDTTVLSVASGATFIHNNGTIKISGSYESTCSGPVYPIKFYADFPAGVAVNNLIVANRTFGCGGFPTYASLGAGKVIAKNLTVQGVAMDGLWDVTNDVTSTSTAGSGAAIVSLVGTGAQNVTASVAGAMIPRLVINNSSGSTIAFSGTINAQRGFEYQAGVLNFGTSDIHVNTNFIPPPLPYVFNKLTLRFGVNATSGPTTGDAYTNDFLLNNDTGSSAKFQSSGGDIYVYGNYTAAGAALSGSSSKYIVMTGTNNQSITSTVMNGNIPSLKIDKTGGTLTFSQDTQLSGNFKYVQGSVTPPNTLSTWNGISTYSYDTGALVLNNLTMIGVTNLTVTGTILVGGNFTYVNGGSSSIAFNGGAIEVAGNLSLTNYYIGGTTNFAMTGTSNATFTGNRSGSGTFTINKTGGAGVTMSGASTMTANAGFTVTSGNLDMAGYALTIGGTTAGLALNGNILTKNAGVLKLNNVTIGTGALYGGTINP